MKVVAITENYLPNYNAGSELMMHDILLGLRNLGNEIVVLCEFPNADSIDQIPIYSYDDPKIKSIIKSSDVIISHLRAMSSAFYLKEKYGKPLVMIVHNNRKLDYNKIFKNKSDLLIFNSKWLQNESTAKVKSIVVNPPLIIDNYKTITDGDYVTLINISKEKGGELLYKLAKKMPHINFLGVRGAYGDQFIPNKIPQNLTIINHTKDIKDVYKKTKILLIPSVYETWGKVGLEAAASGIPIIANPTEGLIESLGKSAIFVNRERISQYISSIDTLVNDEKTYKKYSDFAQKRSLEIAERFESQINLLNQSLKNI
jgi:glycosyltransferase involved in cell wall biosynthesis